MRLLAQQAAQKDYLFNIHHDIQKNKIKIKIYFLLAGVFGDVITYIGSSLSNLKSILGSSLLFRSFIAPAIHVVAFPSTGLHRVRSQWEISRLQAWGALSLLRVGIHSLWRISALPDTEVQFHLSDHISYLLPSTIPSQGDIKSRYNMISYHPDAELLLL